MPAGGTTGNYEPVFTIDGKKHTGIWPRVRGEMLTHSRRQFKLAALAIVLLTIVTRLPTLLHPQPIDDEIAYSVVANEMIDGGRPYVDAVERKPPLLFWTYEAVFEAAGEFNWRALHAVALLWTLGTMAGLYAIGKRLFDRATGLTAALLYSVFQPWAEFRNLAFNGELLMNLPIVWAWALVLGRSLSRTGPRILLAGALLCAGFLLKQPAAIAAVPLGIYFFLPSYRTSRGLTWTTSVIRLAMLIAGFFGVLGLVAILLLHQGILGEAFYWTFTAHSIPHVFWENGVLVTLEFIAICLPLFVGAAMAYRDRDVVWAGKDAERTALFGLLVASAIGTAAGSRFYPHYYIQLIPPLALLAAPHFARLWSRSTAPRHWLLRPAATCAWLAVTLVGFSISQWLASDLHLDPCAAAQYLSAHSTAEQRIFVWGQMPRIYLESQRRPASRYIATFPLTGYVFGGPLPGVDTRNRIMPGAWTNLEEDFNKHPPTYIVDVQSNPGDEYPVRDFPVLARLLTEKYRQVARTAEGVIYRRR